MRKKTRILLVTTIVMLLMMAFASACAPKTATPSEENGGSGSVAVGGETSGSMGITWSMDSDCAMCHTAEAASADDATALYSSHVVHGYEDCTSCHTDDGGNLATAHKDYLEAGADMPQKLKKTSVPEETCTAAGCHVIDDLIAATASFAQIVDTNGTVANPHAMLVDELHTSARFACADCHKMHAPSGTSETAVVEAALGKCASCHHEHVFECFTCHD